jgi:hypothetical protein
MSQSNHNLGLVPSIITIKWADLLLLRNRMLFRKIVEIVNVQSREFPQIDPISKLRLFLLQEIPLHAAHISWTRPSITKWCPLPTQNKPEPLDPTWPFGPTLLSLIFVRWLYKFHFICFYETGFMIRFTINRSRYVVLIEIQVNRFRLSHTDPEFMYFGPTWHFCVELTPFRGHEDPNDFFSSKF